MNQPPSLQNWISRDDADETGGLVVGVVKWFDPEKGYGFIEPNQGTGDVFFRWKQKEDAGFGHDLFDPGIPMACETEQTNSGLRATVIWRVR
jgi:CspA family cold shock protein